MKNKPKLIPIWLALLSVFILELLFYTRCRIQCVRIGYEITQKTKEQKNLIATNNALKIELEMLKSPEQIEKKVKQYKLGLKMPRPKQIIEIP